jgi:hypothetical protein
VVAQVGNVMFALALDVVVCFVFAGVVFLPSSPMSCTSGIFKGVSVIGALHPSTHWLAGICEMKSGGDRFDLSRS